MSQSIFKDHKDHDFYDKDCSAHQVLKVCSAYDGIPGIPCYLMDALTLV